MRHPRRFRNTSFAIFLGGAAALTAATMMPDAGDGSTLQGMLAIGGVMAVAFAGVATLVGHHNVRTHDRLLSGEDVIARWHIEPDRWQAFTALNERLDQERGSELINALSIRHPRSGHMVEVIVAKTAVQVDGDFHALPAGTHPVTGIERLPGPPWSSRCCIPPARVIPMSACHCASRSRPARRARSSPPM